MSILLVIIFNHKFDQNISRLEKIYQSRFNNILYIVPYYNGSREDVVSVFGNSYYFHSYIVQAGMRLLGDSSTHYLFAADDLLLHPDLNEANILSVLEVDEGSGKNAFIKELMFLNSNLFVWEHAARAASEFYQSTGINYQSEIPAAAEAWKLVQRHSFSSRTFTEHLLSLRWKRLIKDFPTVASTCITLAAEKRTLDYPLMGSYSDFFLLDRACLPKFLEILAVFAGMNVWVEFSIPTALALACGSISQENGISRKGREFWSEQRDTGLGERFGYSLDRLHEEFYTPETLYVHPIKLSQWK